MFLSGWLHGILPRTRSASGSRPRWGVVWRPRPNGGRSFRPRIDVLEDRTAPALLGNQLFPADSPWNQKITNAPVAANSAAVINNILSNFGNGRLHPDFGQDYQNGTDLYGIPYNVV